MCGLFLLQLYGVVARLRKTAVSLLSHFVVYCRLGFLVRDA